MDLARISKKLSKKLSQLEFAEPVTHVYDPLQYAWAAHAQYLEKFGQGPKRALFLGMNPGPWGMAQTGVPFGEIAHVRDWMGIEAKVKKPKPEHPKRPIEGFECARSEVSGARLWSWAKEHFESADAFFSDFFVVNYCPLCFMEESGKNRTPDKLPAHEREPIEAACDAALREVVEALEPEWLVGVGAFAEARAKKALVDVDIQIGRILHPSPASPIANRGWAPQAEKQLRALGLL